MHHGSVHARRQRLPIVHVGGAVQAGHELQEQDSEEGAQEGDVIQNASRRGNRPLAPSRHGVRTFVHIKDSWKLDAADWEEKVCSYSKKS